MNIKNNIKKLSNFFEDKNPKTLRKRQNILFFSSLFTVVGGIGFVVLVNTSKNVHAADREKGDVRKIETAKESVDQRKVWVERLESEMELIKKKNDQLERLVETLTKKSLADEQIKNQQKESMQSLENNPSISSSQTEVGRTLNASDVQGALKQTQTIQKKSTKLTKIQFNLEENQLKKSHKSIDHYVPAGTFVKARLTSGVVASTAVSSSSDPQPIHMELTDFGTLPREFKTDLKKCFLIGSAYGDLASERVFMRLETLSCVERRSQEVIEIKVDGYVSGEDGANGMRGQIIDKSGPAMRNAFMGGFISGMGSFLSDRNGGTTMISPMGVTAQQALTATELLKGGAGKGVGHAMEKMSDFYIKRAEQLQPVIEIEPGREIDVVFKAGFDMNQTLFRQTLKNHHDRSRQSDVSNTFE